MTIKKYLLSLSNSTFKGLQTLECSRLSNFDFLDYEKLNVTLYIFSNKQWLQRLITASFKTVISFFFIKLDKPFFTHVIESLMLQILKCLFFHDIEAICTYPYIGPIQCDTNVSSNNNYSTFSSIFLCHY